MYALTLRKWFYDLWDNLFFAFLINGAFALLCAIPLVLPSFLFTTSPVLAYLLAILGFLLLFIYLAVIANFAFASACGETFNFSNFIPYLKKSWKVGLTFGIIFLALQFLVSVSVPYYYNLDSLLGMFVLALIAWFVIFWVLSAQYYLPLNAQIEKKLFKVLKKSIIVVIDNALLSLFLLALSLGIVAVSTLTISLFPGVFGLLLLQQVGFKLVMKKYDYLEANPQNLKKKLPWDEILADEKQRTGVRTLRNLIFPWKD